MVWSRSCADGFLLWRVKPFSDFPLLNNCAISWHDFLNPFGTGPARMLLIVWSLFFQTAKFSTGRGPPPVPLLLFDSDNYLLVIDFIVTEPCRAGWRRLTNLSHLLFRTFPQGPSSFSDVVFLFSVSYPPFLIPTLRRSLPSRSSQASPAFPSLSGLPPPHNRDFRGDSFSECPPLPRTLRCCTMLRTSPREPFSSPCPPFS